MPSSRSKISSRRALIRWKIAQKKSGHRIVFTNGCFDILHSGHIKILEAAKKLGDRLVVGLNSDKSVQRLKGPSRPLNKELDRATVLAGLEAVDKVVIFPEDTPAELLKSLRPDILVKGGDYKPHEVAGREFAGKLALIPLVKNRSTTAIIKRMCAKRPSILPNNL